MNWRWTFAHIQQLVQLCIDEPWLQRVAKCSALRVGRFLCKYSAGVQLDSRAREGLADEQIWSELSRFPTFRGLRNADPYSIPYPG